MTEPAAQVVAVSRHGEHRFSKTVLPSIRLIEGIGVEGDAHAGATVKHRSRVARDPHQPNLRQVHLLHQEMLDELAAQGFDLAAGMIGENVLTGGIDLLALSRGTLLRLGAEAEIEVAGLRNPCMQLDGCRKGLMAALLGRAADGTRVRKAGVMAVVRRGGVVRAGDVITLVAPGGPHQPLQPV